MRSGLQLVRRCIRRHDVCRLSILAARGKSRAALATLGVLAILSGLLACADGTPPPDQARVDESAGSPLVTPPAGVGRDESSATGPKAPAADSPDHAQPISLGEGFVVWESNRSGDWRIWSKRLDGTGLRRLTPEEPGRQHFAPHISPDGRWVSYLSSTNSEPEYDTLGTAGSLHLVSAVDGELRLLAESARSYFENRAVVWLDSHRLLYIDGSGATLELDIDTGKRKRWLDGRDGERGWLLSSTLAHATTGEPSFSLFDRERRAVAGRSELGGCQPYFSHDGRWGFWTAGAGGPLQRMDLTTRQVSTILEKNDRRMVADWGYAYFPMLSTDGRLFAYAASRNEHDHFKSDYEVFVVETEPGSLEPIGSAVRITRHRSTDRFPDVFLAPLELGRHRGEAPLTVLLQPSTGDEWSWDFGDGTRGRGATAQHTWAEPGRFEIIAYRGEDQLRGQVVVAEPRAPSAVEATLVEQGRRIRVLFDEEVALDRARVALESGHLVTRWAAGDARTLIIELGEPLRRPDRVVLTGIVDLAQKPNAMAHQFVEVDPPLWPSRRQGLVFLWETALAPNLILDPELGAERSTTLQATRSARLDGHGAMQLDGGSYYADPGDQAVFVRRSLQHRNSFSLELTLTPASLDSDPRSVGSIVSLAGNKRSQNFRLLQKGGVLRFVLHAGSRRHPEVELFRVPAGKPSHVVVTFAVGKFAAYLDGELKVETDELIGDLFHWRDYPLVFGDQWDGGMDWGGRLEGVAIYDRPLEAAEVRENYLRYRSLSDRRPEIRQTVVRAELLRKSRVPTLQQISPYREALALFEYRVVAGQGQVAGEILRVAQWVLLDGKAAAASRAPIGRTYRLVLEPFTANPQVESLYLSDDLGSETGSGKLSFAPDPTLTPETEGR